MKREVQKQAAQYAKNHTRRRRWQKAVTCLAAVVVFSTVYALILPAITLEHEPLCGKTEHTHSDACYAPAESGPVPVCAEDSLSLHRHTEACLDEAGACACGYSDFAVHEHDAACYDRDGNLWCTLPVIEAHTHTAACFAESGEPVCGREEILLHEHDARCLDESGALICGQVQILAHQHTDSCFQTLETLAEEEILICQLEEHTHSQECFEDQTGVIQPPEEEEPPVDETPEEELPPVDEAPEEELPADGAAAETLAEEPLTIELGTYLNVDVAAGQTVKIPFTPEFTHEYVFISQEPNWKDTYGYIYDESGKVIANNDDDGGSRQFKITYTLTGGTRYDLGVKYYSSSNAGTIPVRLSLGSHKYEVDENGYFSCSCGLKEESVGGSCGANVNWSLGTDGVLTISGTGAMYSFSNGPWYPYRNLIKKVVVEAGVTSIGNCAFKGCTDVTEIEIPEGMVTIGNDAFRDCTGLTHVTIPEGVTSIGNSAFYYCNALETITIPSTLTSIGASVFYCKSLKTIYWNAAGDVSIGSNPSNYADFQLVLGPNSKLTQAQYGHFDKLGCTAIDLPEGHYLTLAGIQADFWDIPMTVLPEALYYVNNQGALYRVDEEASTASLAFCPAGLTDYTVPAEIPAADGHGPFTVTGVDTCAFCQSSDLTALTFAAPQQITELSDLAFYDARSLASINGQTTEEAVLALFPDAKKGVSLFENTKIARANTAIGDGVLTLHGEGLEVSITTTPGSSHDPAIDKNGVMQFYTGETVRTDISVSNPAETSVTEGAVLRLYYRMESAEGKLNYEPGTYVLETDKKSTITMTVFETAVPNCYCLELSHPALGETVSLTLTGTYPSPASAGGKGTIWGAILTAEQVAALGSNLAPIDKSHAIFWETVRDNFSVKKDVKNSTSAKLAGNGKGGAYVSGLTYLIKMQREGDTLEGMGKDHMTSAEFVDVITMPAEMQLTDAVRDAIENGTYTTEYSYNSYNDQYKQRFFLPDGTLLLSIQKDNGSSDSWGGAKNPYLTISSEGYLEIHWTFSNISYQAKEIGNAEFTLEIGNRCLEISKVEDARTYEVQNDVTTTQHFMHSEDVEKTDDAFVTLKPEAGSLALAKDYPGLGQWLTAGTSTAMELTLTNPKTGISPPTDRIEDPLPNRLYMKAEHMAEALCEDHQLTIEIKGASLCDPVPDTPITGVDGESTGKRTQQDTGAGTRYNGISNEDPAERIKDAKIVLAWNESDQLTITVNDGAPVPCEATGTAIQQALDSMGYLIVGRTTYTLIWDLRKDGMPITLVGGETITKKANISLKDTFMHLNADQLNGLSSYSWGTPFDNIAHAYYGENARVSAKDNFRPSNDFYFSKSWSMNGQKIEQETQLESGMVLDYTLTANHYGSARYDVLPMTDHLEGAQALLAPVSLNQGEKWAASCATVTLKDGSEYYILKDPKTYSRVWTGPNQMADQVVVQKTDTGLDTLIKWYFTDYSGEHKDTFKYHAMVCPQEVLPDEAKTFTVSNEAWLGDHESHRLYATISGWEGSRLNFDKKIVANVGDDGGWMYSHLKENQAVVYRLTVYGLADEEGNYPEVTLTGQDLYDVLPKSIANWRWDKDKVKIEYHNATKVENGDQWIITEAQNNQQQINWDESFQMTFTERADIYVTLQFPNGEPWADYASAYALTELVNTFHLLGGQASVTHNVSIEGQVRIQKGVYSSGYKGNMGGQTDARWYYSNTDDGYYYVTYYVTIYNGGRTNLYLSDMQDRLPRGFTADLSSEGSYYTNDEWRNFATVYKDEEGNQEVLAQYHYRSLTYRLTSPKTEDGIQYLTIHFGGGSSWNNPISYDREKGMYYLKPGEYTVFSYNARTNKEPDTDPEATNILTMPYYNFNGGGVKIASSSTKVANADKYTPNDGGCEIYSTSDVRSLGFIGGETDTQWLTSQVTVQRGNIKPGITKKLLSATDINGNVTKDPVSVNGGDTLRWAIVADNDGTIGITDYVLTDSMQAPYQFTGTVHFTGYNNYWSQDSTFSDSDLMFDVDLFTIKSWDEKGVTLTWDNGTITLKTDGSFAKLWKRFDWWTPNRNFYVAFSKDPKTGNAIMSLRFEEETWSLWPGCSGVLTLSTKNPENILANKQFFNTAFITPLAQTWDHTVNKGNYTGYQTPYGDAADTVRNSAPVSTAFGYATSSIKSIEEVLDRENRAASTDDRNYIALSDAEHEFTYTLTVNNINEKAMGSLLLIDRLPEVDDHTVFDENNPRESEFKVSFSSTPNFQVVVRTAGGTETTLDPTAYTLEFSDKTEFVEADWSGDSTDWYTDLANHRTVRLQIHDDTGERIPAKSSVSLRFNCKVDDPNTALPGQIAWNAFGYHYSMLGESVYLDAAPLKVGVKIPVVPKVVKKLVDHKGAAMTAETEQTYSFLIYPGEALTETWETAEELKALLDGKGLTYKTFSATVPARASESEPVSLPENDGVWQWKRGDKYTVVELPTGEDAEFGFRNFGVITKNAYTFTYDPAQDHIITCANHCQIWDVNLTKLEPSTDGTAVEKPLAGAVFALYSPDSRDQTTETFEGAEATIEQDGATWYLVSVRTTDENGAIRWTDLKRQRYCLVELKAPDGYKLPNANRRILNRDEESQGVLAVKVYNYPAGYRLPDSGGMGTIPYTVGGLLLTLAAAFLLYKKKTRRKEDFASS